MAQNLQFVGFTIRFYAVKLLINKDFTAYKRFVCSVGILKQRHPIFGKWWRVSSSGIDSRKREIKLNRQRIALRAAVGAWKAEDQALRQDSGAPGLNKWPLHVPRLEEGDRPGGLSYAA
jgi:hypothetical protein